MSTFEELADRVWVARHEYLDVNVTAIRGERGVLLVDSLWSQRSGLALREAASALGEVVAVVNTHHHFDHVLGNGAFADVGVLAHENAARNLEAHVADIKAACAADPTEPYGEDIVATPVVVPADTFSSARVIDLGDRTVEVLHPGRGHTDGDVVVRVPDADVLLAGDLVEESTSRHAVPGFGGDCFPLEWPTSLDLVLQLVGAGTVVVPGHGWAVDRDFVSEQRAAIGVVAETIRDLASRGVPLDQALTAAEWPYPAESLVDAVRRGYEHLPRSQKRLPLI